MAEKDPMETKESTYWVTFVVLAVLTLAQIGVSFSDFGKKRLLINMAIASFQVILLTLYFMHLKESDNLTKITAVAGLFFLGLLFLYVVTDQLTRQWLAF
jgi:cytochrome c oxidase subunit IV